MGWIAIHAKRLARDRFEFLRISREDVVELHVRSEPNKAPAHGVRCRIDRDRMELFLDIESPKETPRPRKSIFDPEYSVEAAIDDLSPQLAERLPATKRA